MSCKKADQQAFTNRLAPLQDLSAHHASSDRSLSEGGSGSGEGFMDGMEGDERECAYFHLAPAIDRHFGGLLALPIACIQTVYRQMAKPDSCPFAV